MFGKRKSGARVGGSPRTFRPAPIRLEDRALMSVDATYAAVGNTTAPTVAPFGVQEIGGLQGNDVGTKVADVGDVNRDGFDDYVVSGIRSQVYLIFGSRSVDSTTITDFLSLSPTVAATTTPVAPFQRNGDITQVGGLNQSSPGLVSTGASPSTGFDFQGLTFTATQLTGSMLGASVAALGDLNGDGFADFAIGAPGNGSATAPTPTVFIIYGSAALAGGTTSPNVDLTTPSSYSTLSVRTLQDTTVTSQFGASIAAVGNVLAVGSNGAGSGSSSIAIGAPGEAPTGRGGSGAVYLIPANATSALSSEPAVGTSTIETVNYVSATSPGVGQTGGIGGSLIIGAASQNIGFSVAGAGNFSGQSSANVPITDLLIGTQTANVAYLVYGAATLATTGETSFTIPNSTTVIRAVDLSTIGTATPTIAGVAFTTSTSTDETGFALSSAGDVDNDSHSDILIGSPGYNTGAGRAWLVFSRSFTILTGIVNLDTQISPVVNALDGPSGSEAGFSLGTVGTLNTSASTSLNLSGDRGLLIGAPGTSQVFIVEYAPNYDNASATTPQSLSTITATTNASGIGAGPGGLEINTTVANTAGQTGLGFSVSGSPTYIVSGGKVDSDSFADFILGAPLFSGLTTTSATGAPPIGPTGITNEGIVFLLEGGPLRAAGFFPAVVGIGGNGGVSPPPPGPPPPPPSGGSSALGSSASTGFVGFDTAAGLIPPLGEALVPTVAALSKNKYYKPISVKVALKTFRPDPSFSTRNGIKGNTKRIVNQNITKKDGINTLPRSVYDSSKFPKGTYTKAIVHKGGPFV